MNKNPFDRDAQKFPNKESSSLSSDHFWRISPEAFELQKISLPLLPSVFEELSAEKRNFQKQSTKPADFAQKADSSIKNNILKKVCHF